MKKKFILLSLLSIILLFTACNKNKYIKNQDTIFGTFDTIIDFTAYTETEEEYKKYYSLVKEEFNRLHKLYDIYNDYEGINNIKAINDMAGIEPVEVDRDIIELLKFSKNMTEKYSYKTNIAFGPVLNIWHEYREEALDENNKEKPEVPNIEELKSASQHTDINKVIINEENSTVFLEDEKMSLDIGATSKGYASQLVMNKVREAGCKSAILSAGGNVISIGKPMEKDKDKWGIGIQNPNSEKGDTGSSIIDIVYGNNISLVTSGDYQRYYEVDGKIYNHIIDPDTLVPGDLYKSVTVLAEDSGVADFLSTTLFLLPIEEGKDLIKDIDNVEVIWIDKNEKKHITEGMKNYLQSEGITAKED
ncbi:FAD:protein FMN transferase [Miniphocaeibacter halophilus]|uniref:FAD:protein FMN transferase n=1 Tax=Miniphocaeibacter halophilus TaxID=2931922 RepID=A0AC61MY32_9FIRM|nr:FAD:protein FMN transferase [Miniphocaeibacter halophilus]QQK08700.1 FAD:protein FMN transferase [Miniphocaeibacter halophilus]